jgi:hypothetical protein
MGLSGLSLWQLLIIMLLSLSGDLKPNTEVLLGTPGSTRISLDVQEDGWIDLSLIADGNSSSNTAKFKIENGTFIFPEGIGIGLPSAASPSDASENAQIKIADILSAASSGLGVTANLKEYGPRSLSVSMKEERSGTATEITVTRRDGAIVVETPDAVIVHMPVTINQHAETNGH